MISTGPAKRMEWMCAFAFLFLFLSVIPAHVDAGPDLDISATYEPAEPREGDTIIFTVEIENTGDEDASNVTVSLLVDGTEVDQQNETIGIGETKTVQVQWEAEPGQPHIAIEVTDSGEILASIPDIPMDIRATEPFFDSPWIPVILFILLIIGIIGGPIGLAYLARETGKAKRAKALPAEEATVVTIGKHDPCEEIRRKWRIIDAEYERAKAEMQSLERGAAALVEAEGEESGQAEDEYNALKHEVESLGTKAEAFRLRWRMCMLKKLDEAAGRAETSAQEAAEAARRAREATNQEQYEKAKEEADVSRERVVQAREDSEGIERQLEEEGMEEDTSEFDDRIQRAERDAVSAVEKVQSTVIKLSPRD